MSSGTSRTVENAVCTFCGCTCDDVALVTAGGRIVEARRACEEGRAWFEARSETPEVEAYVDGRPASAGDAIEVAARFLAGARAPLVYGLVEASGAAQGAAVELADLLGAALDTPTSGSHGPWLAAFQRRGVRSATLAEVRNRADLVVLWETAPERSHPRFFERFVEPGGLYVVGQRVIVAMSQPRAPTSSHANRAFSVPEGRAIETLWALRAIVRGRPLGAEIERVTGVPRDGLEEWVAVLTGCRYGAWVYDADSAVEPALAEAVLALVEALDERVPFAALGLRGRGNPAGAESVVTSRTGYPFAVNFRRGYPRFEPGRSTTDLLASGAVDAALLIGCNPQDALPERARRALASIPTAIVDFRESEIARRVRAAIFTATYGVSAPATVARMDGIALRARPALESALPSDAAVVRQLLDRVAALRRKGSAS